MKRALLQAEALAPVVMRAETEASASRPEAPSDAGIGIRIVDAAKAFGVHTVFETLSLDLAPGAFVAVVGRSGAGKSTLLRMIAGLDALDSGRIENAASWSDVRMLFPEPRLLPWYRVISNVGIARGPDWRARAQAALADVELAERAYDWPAVLSDGQRRRVALARALAGRPKLLLLDEPFAVLDAPTRAEMHQLLIRIRREYGFTGLFVTRDVREALALADRVIVLREGGIVLDEPIHVPRGLRSASPRLGHLERRILTEV